MISSYLKSALTFHLSSSTIIIMNANYSFKKHDNKKTGSAIVVLISSRWTVIDNFFVFVWGLGASVGMYVCVQVISVQYPRS